MSNLTIAILLYSASFIFWAMIYVIIIKRKKISGWIKKKKDRLFYRMGYSPTNFQPVKFDVHEVEPIIVQVESVIPCGFPLSQSVLETEEYKIAERMAHALVNHIEFRFEKSRPYIPHESELRTTGRLKVVPPKAKEA